MFIHCQKKSELENCLAEAKAGVEIEKITKEVVEEFKKYKVVNKKFTDKLQDKGLWAYIIKETYSKTLVIRKKIEGGNFGEYRLYLPTGSQKSLSWDCILKEFERYDYFGQIERYQKRLDAIESDIEVLSRLITDIDRYKFENIDLWQVKNMLFDCRHRLTV